MKYIRRLFGYVWPQWPRVIIVVISAMVIAMLLSVSFMVIIPLLRVMMDPEGLHGWVDRSTCEAAYGLEFYTPHLTDTQQMGPSLQTHLRVDRVAEDSLAARAGIQTQDYISNVSADDVNLWSAEAEPMYPQLLQALAETSQASIRVEFKRFRNGQFESESVQLNTPHNRAYVETLDWKLPRRVKWHAHLAGLSAAQWAVSYLPRGQTDNARIRAVIAIMIGMLFITVLRCIAKFYQDYLGQKIVQTAISELRQDVFVHLTRMPIAVFANERPSDTISRIVRDTNTMTSAIKIMLGKALREPMNALFMLATAMLLNWQLSLVFLCGAPPVVVLLGTFGRRMKRASRRSLESSSRMLGKLQETVAGLRVVKIYDRQEYEQQHFQVINNQLLKQLLRMSKIDAATSPILEVLGMLAAAAAIIAGMAWIAHEGIEEGEFLALIALLGAAAEATRKTSDIWNRIQQANAAAERVFAVLDEPIEPERPDAPELVLSKGSVEFRNIVFTYPNAEQPALTGVTLKVAAGHNVAIVGANGSGKTTLANLLPKFYTPDSGQILIDGQDIADVTLASLRRQIGIVTQQTITFNDTIRANISYGRQDATNDDVVRAAKAAFAHEFVEQLPLKYDTVIGEQGVGLSGGQLQRIVIARAILKNPAILIFDEATSQVDADSEAKIHRAIEEIMQDRTTFIIAHRFSTVVAADVIVVMDRGRIVAQGQHEDLIQTSHIYRGLYETQLVKA